MNKPLRRVISATLALSLSVTLAVNAYAEEIAKVHKQAAVSAEVEAVKEKSEKAKKPEKIKITKDNLPEVLDFDRVKGQGFVSRLKSEEQDMCEIVLENEDGTRGLYVFDSPVKFKNEKGETVDKSNKVKPHTKNGAPCFKSESNDIEVHLPATIQGGVSLKDEEVNVSMKPIPSVMSKRALSVGKQKDENSVVYEDVFDNFTDIVYTFTYDGVKEDIVLEKYNGKNTFDFEVITGGLSLEEEKGALLLKDENGEVKATMGEIVIFSADNKNNTFGEYKITEKQKNNSYILTLCVDVAYLTNPDTKYPVTIDPTISSAHNKCGMQDMQVFKGVDGTGNTETSAGRSGVSRVGWTDWGVCRTLVNFKSDLLTTNNIKYSNQIVEASIEIRDLMCQSQSTTIYCYQFNGLSSWSDTYTKTWNQLQADKLGDIADKKTVSATSGTKPSSNLGNPSTDTWELWHKFTLTDIVKKWTQKSSLISQGLIFKSEYETAAKAAYMKTFSSMEGNENYKPYFFIRYNSIVPVTNVKLSNSSLTLSVGKTHIFYPTVYPSTATNQEFTWESSNEAVATVSSSGKVTAKRAGIAVITVKTSDGKKSSSCNLTVKQVLAYPDTLINDTPTRNKIVTLKTLIDSNEVAYLNKQITYSQKQKIYEQLYNELQLARADYIVVGNNPTSDYAYAILGGNKNSSIPTSFKNTLKLGSQGLEVVVVQRALEVLGYYEPLDSHNYGTFDAETYDAASSFSYLLSETPSGKVFDALSFNCLFQAANKGTRSYKNMSELNEYRITHDEVAQRIADKVGGTADRKSNKISQGGVHYKDKEKGIKYDGYADILKDTGKGTFVWEVKHDNSRYYSGPEIGTKQIQRYLNAGNSASIPQNFTKPLLPGYYIEAFSFLSADGRYIDVHTPSEKGINQALVLYDKRPNDKGPKYKFETEAIKVTEKDYDYIMSYNFVYSGNVITTIVVLGIVVVGGVVGVALAPASGGTSIVVPMTYFVSNYCVV